MKALRMSWTSEDNCLVARWTDSQEHHEFEVVFFAVKMDLPSSLRMPASTGGESVAETIRSLANKSERI